MVPAFVQAQNLSGTVRDASEGANQSPIPGANVFWLGTTQGTVTDAEGRFSLVQPSDASRLVVSFVGYQSDTLTIGEQRQLNIGLKSVLQLKEVTVSGGSTFISRNETIKTETITSRALQKAACCNLSESFETNASVSVSYADAVTGAKQIQMLGLSGTYVQINTENIPSIRGLATTYGLNYIPGTWISSIDVGKGAGSVVNGYESITGQLNVELQKPEISERLYLNTYVNDMGRAEINLNLAQKIGKRDKSRPKEEGWSTGLLLHASGMGDLVKGRMDRNGDGFFDLPMSTQYNAVNRWKYQSKRLMAQFGIKALYENRRGGQLAYYHDSNNPMPTPVVDTTDHSGHGGGTTGMPDAYGIGSTTRRVEGFSKMALLFPDAPYRGLGLILSAANHDQQSFFGLNQYNGQQQTLYANLIYQSIISTTNHAYKLGASYLMDQYRENYQRFAYRDSLFARQESVPGVFAEYTFTIPDKFTLVAGSRIDFHNLYGTLYTPRLHLKYDLSASTILRVSAGSGFRVANPIAENVGMLVSSRQLIVSETLRPEKAWNYGLNMTHDFMIGNRKGTLGVDLYRTDFVNQIITDMETPRQVSFYNLKGKSYANNLQVEVNYQPIKALDLKLAYKLYDVKTTLGQDPSEQRLLEKQFVSRDRVLFNASYATNFDKWKFDFTTQWNGSKRLPDLNFQPGEPSEPLYSPAYFILNAQVTKAFKKWDLYVGGENLANFTQKNPIVAADQPFGPNFDGSLAWGPIFGRMIYAGMRFKIK
jgi:outer membrane receptor for ferrienterochelin and colicin